VADPKASDDVTRSAPAHLSPPPPGARFSSGSLLGGRYRIVGPLGKGGMGEVYRAEDLKLGQTVALKFLPDSLEDDPAWLARFHNEVRLAREVTHPNVCRVHDIGEADGLHFLSMEYVDGEDLASLLRRIGRLSTDKGLEIARQLCAGLAAAHAQGVLHRDLKPANVMLDGRGRVRITDFGLAGLAGAVPSTEVASGTPAYMAPEQALGKEVSVRSDIYALGLILYEIFTGRPAFSGSTPADLLRAQVDNTPTSPSQLVAELDPSIERAILRCLEKEPRLRPASAVAVSAALPGGDPLAAAVAAGVTPSPEMVAAAGEVGAVPRAVALRWLGLALTLCVLAYAVYFSWNFHVIQRVPMELSPEALALRARDSLDRLQLSRGPYRAHGLEYDNDILRHIVQREASASRWDNLPTGQPAVVYFWYRESPEPLVSARALGQVSEQNPAPVTPGMLNASFDTRGRLISLRRTPPREIIRSREDVAPDWAALFREAGLDFPRFRQVETAWAPPVFADSRGTWLGTYALRPEIPIRIEAAALQGRPVYFEIIGPWYDRTPRGFGYAGYDLIAAGLLGGGVLLARRNLRLGRGDRRGALRLAAFTFTIAMLQWVCEASHVADALGEWFLFTRATAWALFWSASLWIFYLALEPHVRRIWPETLVSWSRLLAGGFRDPLVGRDVLIGMAAGCASLLLGGLTVVAPAVLTDAPLRLVAEVDLSALLGPRHLAGAVFEAVRSAIDGGFVYVTMLLLVQILLRRRRLAAFVFIATITATTYGAFGQWMGGSHPLDVVFIGVMTAVIYLVITRVGLLAVIAMMFPVGLSLAFPLVSLDLGAWHSAPFLVTVLVCLGLLAYAFDTALGGQPLYRDDVLPG
jgi:serine/threonine-protein kinase